MSTPRAGLLRGLTHAGNRISQDTTETDKEPYGNGQGVSIETTGSKILPSSQNPAYCLCTLNETLCSELVRQDTSAVLGAPRC